MGTDTGINLFSPGKDREDNLRFITFVVNTLMAVYKFNGLLKASIASATNAHRLGANEAPPAIISSFLGTQISEVLDKFENSSIEDAIEVDDKKRLSLGFGQIPELLLDNTDRNRTSPFAFTGNRFEFRAPGSSVNCGSAMLAVNSAVAYQLQQFKKDVEALQAAGKSKEVAIFETLKAYIKESKPIRFDGNGYCDEWKAEAARRGLDCENSVPLQYDAYLKPEVIRMFRETGVLSEKGAGSPQRSEMGNLYQKGTDRSSCPWRPIAQPYHPGCRPLPVIAIGQHRQTERDFRRISGICRYVGRAPKPGSQDCRTYLFRHSHGGRNGGSPQKSKPYHGFAYQSDRLPRYRRSLPGRNPQPYRRAGTDGRQPDVAAAKIQGTFVYPLI